MSLGVGFEVTQAEIRSIVSHFLSLLSVDLDVELLALSPAP